MKKHQISASGELLFFRNLLNFLFLWASEMLFGVLWLKLPVFISSSLFSVDLIGRWTCINLEFTICRILSFPGTNDRQTPPLHQRTPYAAEEHGSYKETKQSS